ncbi:Sulfurtransferase TusE [Piscirickettsia salmonis]|uniref:Sulfurtransferase n=1 Tax=Piscirickettsia salmonis TaxID=1238 RepID=A0A1L6TDF0_PISSA|nr:TusE/DsrC/DsvC family sulfur relay protein [Piscirickettsia salmonis]AKP74486.1 sulfur relay protein TusE [Piscirickettsia salmonis LF-89 = ATCC VR-1361]ALB23456.1 sulfur relay, DsrC [Piscirickettsia salmonis]ALY03334.1 sulfur relay protein TusE [Piscirickettsia salmonis]AMA42900.1 sulfur relay protein TusE [Piscirickettsia salmonis]AOS35368.1 sulfur relay protein TusE [Piscirickettsia salmonis]
MTLHFNQQTIQTDSHGYLKNPTDWQPELAQILAKQEGISLTKNHWEIIHFVRNFYQKYHTSPAIRMLVKALKEEYGAEKGNSLYLIKLFPQGAAKQATKIAGLPKPARCI